MIEIILNSIHHFYPEITITATLCVIILGDLLLKKRDHTTGWILVAGLGVSGLFVLLQTGRMESVFYDMVAVDPFAVFFKVILILASLFIVMFSIKCKELDSYHSRIGEYYMLLTGMILGMFLMAGSTNLMLMYLAFELTSISSYVLAGFARRSLKSAEASMKFIIFGAVSSGILLYGISLLTGITGAVDLYGVNASLIDGMDQPMVLSAAILMIVAGFGFKIAVVPFHFWAPDVYEGAPMPIAAYLAVASKIAGFAMLIRFFKISFMDVNAIPTFGLWGLIEGVNWTILLSVMAAMAMIVGNLAALRQDNIKRLLAYSSIAHAGYMLMGLIVMTDEGTTSILIYIFIYLFMNLGAFYIAMLFANQLNSESIESYKGLGFRAPLESIAMTIFLIALTGLPPTAGFIAKLYIFGAAVSAGWIWLVLIAGVTTVISLFYYIRVVRNMFFFKPESNSSRMIFDGGSRIVLLFLLAPTLFLGIYFTPVLEFARNSIKMFGM
ncbi:MAG: NADH-quinone oxidoreductase subunit N [Balneolaceae bacterium]